MTYLDLYNYFFNTSSVIDTYKFYHIEKPINDMVMFAFYNLIFCQIGILIIYWIYPLSKNFLNKY